MKNIVCTHCIILTSIKNSIQCKNFNCTFKQLSNYLNKNSVINYSKDYKRTTFSGILSYSFKDKRPFFYIKSLSTWHSIDK